MNTNPQLAIAQHNMVENQVRPWEVLDARVLGVLGSVPREAFVPAAYTQLAYTDAMLPIGHDEVMLKPVVEGRILQAVLPQAREHVLEIGTGTGYFAACLARLCGLVTTIDHRAEFIDAAQARLRRHGVGNVNCVQANAVAGFSPKRDFDAIVVTGAVATLPAIFGDWLKRSGRMFVIRGTSPAMQAVLLQRASDGGWIEERLFETDVPYLAGAAPSAQFQL